MALRMYGAHPFNPELRVCNISVGITGSGDTAACATGTDLTSSAIAIIFSVNKNGGALPSGEDELANRSNNRTFVSHTQSPPSAPQGEFDDLVDWLSPNILYNRIISAGRLPLRNTISFQLERFRCL